MIYNLLSLKSFSPHLCRALIPGWGVGGLSFFIGSFPALLGLWILNYREHIPLAWKGRPRWGLWCWAIRLWGQRNGQHIPWPSFGLCQLTLTQKIPKHSQGPGLIPSEWWGHGHCFVELSCTTWPQGKEPFPGLCSFPFSLSVRREVRD